MGLLSKCYHWEGTQPHLPKGGYAWRFGYDRNTLVCITLDITEISDEETYDVAKIIDQLENSPYDVAKTPPEGAVAPPYLGCTFYGNNVNIWMVGEKPLAMLFDVNDAEAHTVGLNYVSEAVKMVQKQAFAKPHMVPHKLNAEMIIWLPTKYTSRRIGVLLTGLKDRNCRQLNPHAQASWPIGKYLLKKENTMGKECSLTVTKTKLSCWISGLLLHVLHKIFHVSLDKRRELNPYDNVHGGIDWVKSFLAASLNPQKDQHLCNPCLLFVAKNFGRIMSFTMDYMDFKMILSPSTLIAAASRAISYNPGGWKTRKNPGGRDAQNLHHDYYSTTRVYDCFA